MNWNKILRGLSVTLTAIGSFVWGLYGLTGLFTLPLNLIDYLLKPDSFLGNVVYLLVGLSAVYLLVKKK